MATKRITLNNFTRIVMFVTKQRESIHKKLTRKEFVNFVKEGTGETMSDKAVESVKKELEIEFATPKRSDRNWPSRLSKIGRSGPIIARELVKLFRKLGEPVSEDLAKIASLPVSANEHREQAGIPVKSIPHPETIKVAG